MVEAIKMTPEREKSRGGLEPSVEPLERPPVDVIVTEIGDDFTTVVVVDESLNIPERWRDRTHYHFPTEPLQEKGVDRAGHHLKLNLPPGVQGPTILEMGCVTDFLGIPDQYSVDGQLKHIQKLIVGLDLDEIERLFGVHTSDTPDMPPGAPPG